MRMDDSTTTSDVLHKALLHTEYIEQSFLPKMEVEVVHEEESEWPALPVQ